MTVRQEQINDLYSADVVTQDDENLGGVGQVYLDDHTGEPSWISVKTGWFGTKENLVPLEGAELTGDGKVRVMHTKETIKDAPNVDADAHLSSQDQDELFRYYGGAGMDVSRYGDRDTTRESGVGGRDRDRDAAVGDVRGHQGVHSGDRTDDDRMLGSDTERRGTDTDRRGTDTDRGDHLTHGRDRTDDGSMTLHEERVDVGTEQVETGRVGLRKHVVTDQETVSVPVQREEVEIVREPVGEGEAHDGGRLGDEETEVTLHEERPVVDKDVVATERVGVQKQTVSDEKQVVTDVSHEEVDVDEHGTGSGRSGDGRHRDGLTDDVDRDSRRDV